MSAGTCYVIGESTFLRNICTVVWLCNGSYLEDTMTYLLSVLKAREKSSASNAFRAIGLLTQAVGPNIKRHLPKISEAVRMSLPVKDAAAKSVYFDVFFPRLVQ